MTSRSSGVACGLQRAASAPPSPLCAAMMHTRALRCSIAATSCHGPPQTMFALIDLRLHKARDVITSSRPLLLTLSSIQRYLDGCCTLCTACRAHLQSLHQLLVRHKAAQRLEVRQRERHFGLVIVILIHLQASDSTGSPQIFSSICLCPAHHCGCRRHAIASSHRAADQAVRCMSEECSRGMSVDASMATEARKVGLRAARWAAPCAAAAPAPCPGATGWTAPSAPTAPGAAPAHGSAHARVTAIGCMSLFRSQTQGQQVRTGHGLSPKELQGWQPSDASPS